MGFKTVAQYNEERFGGFFLLRNDGDYADVIFLYQSVDDALVADVHYIKSAEYTGYIHCAERGCPACAKGIRTQPKLFIPLYNIEAGEIQFFDRSTRFEAQLKHDVFDKFTDPSQYVFRITRHGVARSVDTTYEITAIGKNTVKSYHQILAENNAIMPDYYSNICKEFTIPEIQNLLSDGASSYSANDDYSATYGAQPRQARPVVQEPPQMETPSVATPTYSAPPAEGDLPDYTPEQPVVASAPAITTPEPEADNVPWEDNSYDIPEPVDF